jgi:hypothetical protein
MIEGEVASVEDMTTELSEKRPYYFQLDVLKAIAIAFVVMDHSLTWEIKGAMGSIFWERLSIPFFLIVMGFNMGISFKYRNPRCLRELYSLSYFKRKLKRYVLPFIVLYMASIIVGINVGYINTNEYLLLGYLPFWGPGNWFIPLLFSSILVFPLIYWLFEKQPTVTMVLCFLSEIVLQYFLWFLYPAATSDFDRFIISVIRVNILFFLPAVALGLWFSKGFDLRKRRNWFMYLYAPISIVFMIDYATISSLTGRGIIGSFPNQIGEFFSFVQDFIKGDYTLLFYGYAALLFLFAMEMINNTTTGLITRFIQRIGKSTYHILLFQIFWMSLVYWSVTPDAVYYAYIPDFEALLGWPNPLFYIPFYLYNLVISFTGGLVWYEVEKRLLYNQKLE